MMISSTNYASYTQAPRRPDYFQYLDQDQNQSVSTDELSVMAEKLAELTGEEVSSSDLMSLIDQDGDSEITGEELKSHLDSILGESGSPLKHPGMMMEGAMRRGMMMEGAQGGQRPEGPPPPPPGGKQADGAQETEGSWDISQLLESLNASEDDSDSESLLDYLINSEDTEEQGILSGIYSAMIQESRMTYLNINSEA